MYYKNREKFAVFRYILKYRVHIFDEIERK